MKRALSSLIENTDVREFKIVNIEVEKIRPCIIRYGPKHERCKDNR